MPAGLQVLNNGSFVQIDATYKNYCLVQQGGILLLSGNSETDKASYPYNLVTVYGCTNPVLAMKAPGPIRVSRTNLGGGTFQFYMTVDYNWSAPGAGGQPTVPYYVYDSQPTSAAAHGAGLQVFGADGQPVFDSERPYMKVIDALDLTASFPYPNRTETTYNYSGRNVATITCQQAYKVTLDAVGGADGFTLSTMCPVVKSSNPGAVVMVDGAGYWIIGGATSSTQSRAYILVLDVAGL